MAKRLIVALGILGAFSLGAGGGIWAQAFLLPYFSSHPMFKNLQFVKEWNERTTVIREVQEITITKEEGVIRTVEAAQKAVVGIRATNINTVLNGSGLILTSDGFIITLAEVVPVGYTATVYLKEGESIDAQV
jgi:S1-C subfamily serine protease